MGKDWRVFKKYHKWPGLIIGFILLYYAVTGILMNHRELISVVDINKIGRAHV